MRPVRGSVGLICAAMICPAAPLVLSTPVNGIIHSITVEQVGRVLDAAEQRNAALVLLRFDTPGGHLESTRELISRMAAARVPIAGFVGPSGARAASAGFFLLQACDVAAMAPGTATGAASPVLLSGQMDAVTRRKVENDSAATIRGLALARGRDAAAAEKTVFDAKSFTDSEALAARLIELTAASEQELLAKLDGQEVRRMNGGPVVLKLSGATIESVEQTWRERLFGALADPNLALLLVLLGIVGIYAEFSSPGLFLPGAGGAILALLGLSSLAILPLRAGGIALVLLAIVLFILEAKFVSHGILAIGGVVAMIIGSMILIDSPAPELRIRWTTAVAVTLPFAFITVFLLTLVFRARANKVVTGAEGMLGQTGVAITGISPDGRVLVRGEYWKAHSRQPIPEGGAVRVEAVDGLLLEVSPVSPGGKP